MKAKVSSQTQALIASKTKFALDWGVPDLYANAYASGEPLLGEEGIINVNISEALKQLEFTRNGVLIHEQSNLILTSKTVCIAQPSSIENARIDFKVLLAEPEDYFQYIEIYGHMSVNIDLCAKMIHLLSVKLDEIYLTEKNMETHDENCIEIRDIFFRSLTVVDVDHAIKTLSEQILYHYQVNTDLLNIFEVVES